MAAATQADMVLELLRAIHQHRTYTPATLSPFTEKAYTEAETIRRSWAEAEVA